MSGNLILDLFQDPATSISWWTLSFNHHFRQIANMFFKEVVSRLVGSFSERCRLIYGPGVPIIENTYDERI
ncbi:UNVERIFIED_CONTAM: hypothetical protein Sradi_3767900 [Sesamum radiatum]|uniref:Uncharacterized protein n=1 Tax=Sesamum radiatum TaxID=300843 RepID=A0AAW2PZ31_SESRA